MVAPSRYVEVGKMWWDGEHSHFIQQIGNAAPELFPDSEIAS
jgi:hypothetical protein